MTLINPKPLNDMCTRHWKCSETLMFKS